MTRDIPTVCDRRISGTSRLRSRGAVTALVVLLGVTGLELFTSQSWAQSPDRVELGRPTEEGQITNVGSGSIDVERRSYRLHPKLSITTEGGLPFALKDLQVGHGVQVWMSEGAAIKVIVMYPR